MFGCDGGERERRGLRGQFGGAGRWHTMKPGGLYWFGDNIPTGYMVPFRENAYILIFKAAPGSNDAEFMTYLKGMAEGLVKDQAKGTAFGLSIGRRDTEDWLWRGR